MASGSGVISARLKLRMLAGARSKSCACNSLKSVVLMLRTGTTSARLCHGQFQNNAATILEGKRSTHLTAGGGINAALPSLPFRRGDGDFPLLVGATKGALLSRRQTVRERRAQELCLVVAKPLEVLRLRED